MTTTPPEYDFTEPVPVTPADSVAGVAPAAVAATGRRKTVLSAVAWVAAGLVAGGVGVAAVQSHASTTQTPTASQFGGPPGSGQAGGGQAGSGPQSGGQLGGRGGFDGEQRVSGTVKSVGSTTVTVTTSSGTSTYPVDGSTQILRNGSVVALLAIQPGDPVLLHVYPLNGQEKVERLLAGSSATSGPGGGPGPGFGGPPGGAGQTGPNGAPAGTGQAGTTSTT